MPPGLPTRRWRAVCDAMAEAVGLDWTREVYPSRAEWFLASPGELFEALVLHESRGDPGAVNDNHSPEPLAWDYGLCQINGRTFCDLLGGTEFYDHILDRVNGMAPHPLYPGRERFLRAALLLPLRNLSLGLQRLLQCLKQAEGDLVAALGYYNGDRSGAYAERVLGALREVREDRDREREKREAGRG